MRFLPQPDLPDLRAVQEPIRVAEVRFPVQKNVSHSVQ